MDESSSLDAESSAQEHLVKALNYQRMGLMSSAIQELHLARQLNPAIVTDPRYQSFHAEKAAKVAQDEAWKLPMRVGAGILIADILLTLVIWLLYLTEGKIEAFLFWGVVHIAIDLYLMINLLRFKDTARRATILWAAIGLILGGLATLATRSWLDMVTQLSYSGSLIILLVGKPSNVRAGLAAGLFTIGYLGSICAVFVLSFTNNIR
jgi:hypothetical protein